MKYLTYPAIIFSVSLLFSCSSDSGASASRESDSSAAVAQASPGWILHPPREKDYIFGIGCDPDPELAKQRSLINAGQQMGSRIQTSLEEYVREGEGASESLVTSFQTEVTDQSLKGAKFVDQYCDDLGTYWVLSRAPLSCTLDMAESMLLSYQLELSVDKAAVNRILDRASEELAVQEAYYREELKDDEVGALVLESGAARLFVYPEYQFPMSWEEAAHRAGTLSAYGYSDWRLPTRTELDILIEHRESLPGFRSDWYWTAHNLDSRFSIVKSLKNGKDKMYSKESTQSFYMVRSDDFPYTMIPRTTGREGEKATLSGAYVFSSGDMDLYISEYHSPVTWADAKAACDSLTSFGFDDWRLPTEEEMLLLFQHEDSLTDFRYDWYWTSDEKNRRKALILNMASGKSSYYKKKSAQSFYAVRTETRAGN